MRFFCIFATLGLVVPIFGAPQKNEIFETMEVQRYQVQVNVTDRDGEPVRDLTAESFKVKLDGKIQKVETLELVDLTVVEPGEQLSQHGRRLFVFLFDFRYTTERGVLAAQTAALRFVEEELLPTDLVAVFSASPLRGLLTVTNFTADRVHLARALQTLGLVSAKELARGPAGYFNHGVLIESFGPLQAGLNAGGKFFISDPSEGGRHDIPEPDPDRAPGLANLGQTFAPDALDALRENIQEARKSERRNYAGEVMKFNKGLDVLAKALAYTRGRKNLILFSAGFDSSVLTGFDQRSLMDNAEKSLTQDIAEIDSNQMGNSSVMSFAKDLIESLQGSGTVVFALDTSTIDETSDLKSGIQSLSALALDTGGRLFENQNDLSKPMQQIKQITNNYYVLTLVPSGNFEPGSIVKLRIDVDVPRAKVTAQRGLLIRPDFSKLNGLERQLHIADYLSKDLVSAEIPAEMDIVPIPETDQLVRLLVSMEIRGDYFLGKSLDDARGMEFFVLAIDPESNITFDTVASQYNLSLGKAEDILKQTGIKYLTSLLVKPGNYKLKLVTRDLSNGKVGSLMRNITVDAEQPPVTAVALADMPWVTLFGERETQVGIDLSYPFRRGESSFVPKTEARFASNEKAKFFFLIDSQGGDAARTTGVKALIQDKNGQVRVIPAAAMQADFSQPESKGKTPVLLLVDIAQLGLNEGESYKLLTQFDLEEGNPIRWVIDFSM